MEVDFHGMTWPDARDAFLDVYKEAVIQSGSEAARSVIVVHGYGSTGSGGVLRLRFREYLEGYRKRLAFKAGEDIDGNRGWTLVQPISPLADDEDLEDLILDYCSQPRTLNDIVGRFSGYGDPKVWRAVEALRKSPPLLTNVGNSKLVLYQAI